MAYYPDPATEVALPLSGTDERMLRAGGHFKPRKDLYLSKGRKPDDPPWYKGIPRRQLRVVEFYPGEFYSEPDPNVSNAATTGRLIRRMLEKHWNREQIFNALSRRSNCGGLWFQWIGCPADLLDEFISGSKLPEGFQPANGKGPISPDPSTDSLGKGPISPLEKGPITPPGEGSETQGGFRIVPAIVERFLAYAQEAPRSRTDLIKRGPVWHKGAAARYVDHLTDLGLLRWVDGPRTKPRGPVPQVAQVVRADLVAEVASWLSEPKTNPPA